MTTRFKNYIEMYQRDDLDVTEVYKSFTRSVGYVRLQHQTTTNTVYTNIQSADLLHKVIKAINDIALYYPEDTAFEVIMGLINSSFSYMSGPYMSNRKEVYGIPVHVYPHVEGFVLLPIRKIPS